MGQAQRQSDTASSQGPCGEARPDSGAHEERAGGLPVREAFAQPAGKVDGLILLPVNLVKTGFRRPERRWVSRDTNNRRWAPRLH